MKKIFVRSPYFIEVDEVGQQVVKLEIFLWNKGTTEPTEPSYTITENVPSATQTKISLNVSNYAKDFIKPIAPTYITEPTEENVNTWCYMRVVSYSDNVEVNDETFVCLNGYTLYNNGYNVSLSSAVIPLVNPDIKKYVSLFGESYLNFWLDAGTYDVDYNTFTEVFEVLEDSVWSIPVSSNSFSLNGVEYTQEFEAEEICEPIYTPIVCSFINRFGGWDFITFFKANQQAIDVTSKEFNLMPSSVDYNIQIGQKKRFNFQGTQRIKCNTGWVDENYSELIQDLLLSEVVILDYKPAIVKSQSFDIKTHLKDKNINYEIDFEFNYGLINDVI